MYGQNSFDPSFARSHFRPISNNTLDSGSTTLAWRNVYAGTLIKAGDFLSTAITGLGDGQFYAQREGSNAKMRIVTVGSGVQGFLAFDTINGTAASPTAIDTRTMGSVVAVGHDDTSTMAHGSEISLISTETWSASGHGSGFKFWTVLGGTTSQVTSLWLNFGGVGAHYLFGGNNANGHLNFQLGHASATILLNNASGNTMWTVNNSGSIIQHATNGGNLIFNKEFAILAGTSDGSDNLSLTLCAGGASALESRGGYITINGNEHAGTGSVQIWGGNVSGGHILMVLGNAANEIRLFNSATAQMWVVDNSGNIRQNSTNGSFLIFNRANQTINFAGTMGDSAKVVGVDAPADWVEIQIGGTVRYLPAYAA